LFTERQENNIATIVDHDKRVGNASKSVGLTGNEEALFRFRAATAKMWGGRPPFSFCAMVLSPVPVPVKESFAYSTLAIFRLFFERGTTTGCSGVERRNRPFEPRSQKEPSYKSPKACRGKGEAERIQFQGGAANEPGSKVVHCRPKHI
jgi:hypothetical protein